MTAGGWMELFTQQIPVEEDERRVKQVIVIRRDLGMRRGKEIAQGSHASGAWLAERVMDGRRRDGPVSLSRAEWLWLTGLFTKVVCQVPDLPALEAVAARAEEAGLTVHVVTDAGKTEFAGRETVTAAAIGPDWSDAVDAVTGGLKLY